MGNNQLKIIHLLTIVLLIIFPAGCREENKRKVSSETVTADPMKSERTEADYKEAIRNFKALLKKEPDNVILLISLGNAYFDIGYDREAIEAYKKALEIYPDSVAVRTDLGTAYRSCLLYTSDAADE